MVRHKIGREDFREMAQSVLSNGKNLVFVAGGTSMAPLIKGGDTVIITPDKQVNIGDVALVKTDSGNLLLHRVIRKRKEGVITMGDASLLDDGCIPYENIMGKVVEVSGNGYNFHLKNPFKYVIGNCPMVIRSLRNCPPIMRICKGIARVFC